jgi:WD40 repeat protein
MELKMTWGTSTRDFGKFVLTLAIILAGPSLVRAQRPQEEFLEPAPSKPRVFGSDPQLRENIKKLRDFDGHRQKITGLAFCSDAKRALSCSEDGTLRCWELETGKEVWNAISFPGVQLHSVAIRGDDKQAVVGGTDDKLYVCDVDQGRIEETLEGSANGLTEVAISPDGKFAAAADGQGLGFAWDLGTGVREQLSSPIRDGKFVHFQFHPDSRTLWASGDFQAIVNYKVGRWKGMVVAFPNNVSLNRRFAFSTDGKYLLMASRNSFCVAAQRGPMAFYVRDDRPEHASSLPRIEQVAGIGQDCLALSAGDGAIEIWRGRDDQPAG